MYTINRTSIRYYKDFLILKRSFSCGSLRFRAVLEGCCVGLCIIAGTCTFLEACFIG